MKILLAPDSFKGCLTSREVCEALAKGIYKYDAETEIIQIPSSDGGEGFCDCMLNLYGGEKIKREVTSLLGETVSVEYAYNNANKTAFIEFASAAGLHLVSHNSKTILKRTSFGVGEQIKHAISQGAKNIVVGLGGSGTNDCGVGILSALGIKFLDDRGAVLEPIPMNLNKIVSVDKTEMIDISGISIIAACDVNNPLCGKKGAARTFAFQKGATLEDVDFLDTSAMYFSKVLGVNPNCSGYGAAGGAGMALVGVLDASYISGAELLVKSQRFQNALSQADLLITGEGNTDGQTVFGKLISVLLSSAKEKAVDTIIISGGLSEGYDVLYEFGASAIYSLCENDKDREYSISHAAELIENKVKFVLDEYGKK